MLRVKFPFHDRLTMAWGFEDNEPGRGLARKPLCYYKVGTLPFLTKFILRDINKLFLLCPPPNIMWASKWPQTNRTRDKIFLVQECLLNLSARAGPPAGNTGILSPQALAPYRKLSNVIKTNWTQSWGVGKSSHKQQAWKRHSKSKLTRTRISW